ncbi:MAG: SpoIIE family protein phosphatase [Bacteroidia bacterium]|nr:SpoIIE family protein phosphatase [Bacteroidia bacterium]
MKNKFLLCACFALLFPHLLFSQQGIPYIRTYLPKEYQAHSQIFSICQDNRGVMYFANTPFITEYDGKNFRQIKITDRFVTVRSLTKGNDGKIYVGTESDFGYIGPDKKGIMRFHSFMNLIDSSERNFDIVWTTCALGNKVFFSTYQKILVYENNKITIIKPKSKFHLTFSSGKKVYTLDKGEGLKSIEGNILKPVPGSEKFEGLSAAIDFGADSLLIASESKLYIHDGIKVTPFICEAGDYLLNNRLYRMIKLSDTTFAAATLRGGLVLLNKKGNIKMIINKDIGLQSDVVLSVFSDTAGNLWAGSENGFCKIEISSPITEFDSRNGLTGTVNSFKFFKNSIYAATDNGVFYLQKNNCGFTDKFIPLEEIKYQSFDLDYFDNSLIAATGGGLFEISRNNKVKKISDVIVNTGTTFASVKYKGIMYIGSLRGLLVVQYENNTWKYLGAVENLDCDIRTIAETPEGDLWIGTFAQGLFKVLMSKKFTLAPKIITFTEKDGLPLDWYQVLTLNEKIVIGTEQGLFYFDEKKSRFFNDKSYTEDFSLPHASIVRAEFDKNGTLAVISKGNLAINMRDEKGEFHLYRKPFMRNIKGEFYGLAVDSENYIFAGGPDGAICYNPGIKKNFDIPYYALIRFIMAGRDTLFRGNFFDMNNNVILIQPEHQKPIIEYKHNSLAFEFSAAYFEPESSLLFQYFLEGNDTCWSQQSVDTKAIYTNLSEGNYKFRVKAYNIYEDQSKESVYMFTILPPWYRTVWAYIGYIVLFILLVYIAIQISVYRLKAAKRRLEQIVQERTQEIREKNVVLEQQNEEIRAQRDEIEIQKHIIEEKNEEVMDSIHYAKRIQQAVLPGSELFDSLVADYFILFMPKDIVSGDFYFFAKRRYWLLAAVADCTGHGVPGAFMSMMGVSFLNEIVARDDVNTASQVLDELRRHIIKSLQQKGISGEQKDGMDIAFIALNLDTFEMQFAGANNPLYIVSSQQEAGGSEMSKLPTAAANCQLLELKPDKMPVAIHENMLPFTNHKIQIHKEDIIFMFSDGYGDQFGGPKGKKFYEKQLKEMLLVNSHLSMEEQKKILDGTMENWKNSYGVKYEQTDDITVLGIKI